jgi:hypothetical protein
MAKNKEYQQPMNIYRIRNNLEPQYLLAIEKITEINSVINFRYRFAFNLPNVFATTGLQNLYN